MCHSTLSVDTASEGASNCASSRLTVKSIITSLLRGDGRSQQSIALPASYFVLCVLTFLSEASLVGNVTRGHKEHFNYIYYDLRCVSNIKEVHIGCLTDC